MDKLMMRKYQSESTKSSSQASIKSNYSPLPISYKNRNLREFRYEMRQYIITAGYVNKYFGSQIPFMIFIIIQIYYLIPYNIEFAMKYIQYKNCVDFVLGNIRKKHTVIRLLAHKLKSELSEEESERINQSIITEVCGMTNYYFSVYQNPKLLYKHPKYPQKIDFYIKSIGRYHNLLLYI